MNGAMACRRPVPGGALSRTFLWAYHRSVSHAFARSVLEIPSARVLHETYLAAVVFGPERDEAVYAPYGPPRACSSFEAIRDRLARWDGEQGQQQQGQQQQGGALSQRLWDALLGGGGVVAHSSGRCCDDPSHREPRDPAEVGIDRRHLLVKCSPLYQMGQDLATTLPLALPPPAALDLAERSASAAEAVAAAQATTAAALPPPFRHTFLIRRPDKVALSMLALAEGEGHGSDSSNAQALLECDLVETQRLYRFVLDHGLEPPAATATGADATTAVGAGAAAGASAGGAGGGGGGGMAAAAGGGAVAMTPLVIDADDLIANPCRILRGYCERVGLPYSTSMLTWDAGAKQTPLFAPFVSKMHHFTKTGSGQT